MNWHPVGTVVVLHEQHGHLERVIVSRTATPAHEHEGKLVVALEGLDGLWVCDSLYPVDLVVARLGIRVRDGKPIGVHELGNPDNCEGCRRLASGIFLLQEAARRGLLRAEDDEDDEEEETDAN